LRGSGCPGDMLYPFESYPQALDALAVKSHSARDEVQMHCGVVNVLGTCCSYLRATHRPWMHWLCHRGAHDEVQMDCWVVDVMVTC
jgi:hypothetical protein